MRTLLSGGVAVASGLTAVVAAVLALMASPGMGMMPMPAASPVPAYLLLGFGIVVLLNGLLLILGFPLPMGPQGAVMVAYGALMGGVGAVMVATDLFAMMAMAWASAALMFLFGGIMVVLGLQMAVRPGATGSAMGGGSSRDPPTGP